MVMQLLIIMSITSSKDGDIVPKTDPGKPMWNEHSCPNYLEDHNKIIIIQSTDYTCTSLDESDDLHIYIVTSYF